MWTGGDGGRLIWRMTTITLRRGVARHRSAQTQRVRFLLAHWRRKKDAVPVLIITARDSVSDRILGLDTGAR